MIAYKIKVRGINMLYKTYYLSPLGKILLISDEEKLKAVELETQRFHDKSVKEQTIIEEIPILKDVEKWLDDYFKGEKVSCKTLPLAPEGSEFRKAVWEILCDIPYGKTVTYGEIARQIARQKGISSMSAQAVGNAVGHNPISIIIPCHRVVGSNGSLIGYGGGIQNKVKLLTLEKVDMTNLFVPTKGTAL